MRSAVARALVWLLLLTICPCAAMAQQGSANHNVILRRDPSTSSPALAHLQQGARVTLVDASPDSGFYHVRTENDQVGWVFSKFITLSQAPAVTHPRAARNRCTMRRKLMDPRLSPPAADRKESMSVCNGHDSGRDERQET